LRAVTPDPRLGIAIELHKAGRLAEAEKLYREVLQRSPRDGNVLYLLLCVAMFAAFSAVLAYNSWQQIKLGPEMVPAPEQHPGGAAHAVHV